VRPSSNRPRAGRRERQRVTYQRQSFLERYRAAVIIGAALIGVVVIAGFVFFSATQPAYACSTIWTPSPTASPSPGQTPNLGYPQPDMGHTHVGVGATSDGQAAFKTWQANFPPVANCGPVVARFDQMSTPFQAMVWGRVLMMDSWDPDLVNQFWQQWGGRTNLEPLCPTPNSPSASPGASAAPSGTPVPSASAAPSDSAPSAAPSAVPSAAASPS
jgi:hypothetical protein